MHEGGPCYEAIGRFPGRPVGGVGAWGSGEGREARSGPRSAPGPLPRALTSTEQGSDKETWKDHSCHTGLGWAGLRQDSKHMLCQGISPEVWLRGGGKGWGDPVEWVQLWQGAEDGAELSLWPDKCTELTLGQVW